VFAPLVGGASEKPATGLEVLSSMKWTVRNGMGRVKMRICEDIETRSLFRKKMFRPTGVPVQAQLGLRLGRGAVEWTVFNEKRGEKGGTGRKN